MAHGNRAGLVFARGDMQSAAMKDGLRHRAALVLAYLGIILILTGVVWRYAYQQGLDQLAARGQADLALAGDRLVGQLQRYRDLAVLMADHPAIEAALKGGADPQTSALLVEVADKSAARDVLVLDAQGQPLASASPTAPVDLANYAHVQRALRGALGWGHGPALPLTQRAFFHAAPVFNTVGGVMGVVVVVTDLNGIDYNWRGTNRPRSSPMRAERSISRTAQSCCFGNVLRARRV